MKGRIICRAKYRLTIGGLGLAHFAPHCARVNVENTNGKQNEERGIFIITPFPRAALRLPWATIFRPYGSCRLARYARKRFFQRDSISTPARRRLGLCPA